MEQRNDSSQIQDTTTSPAQEQDTSNVNIPEHLKILYSKSDIEQILAEALRLSIDIVKAKKLYVPSNNSMEGYLGPQTRQAPYQAPYQAKPQYQQRAPGGGMYGYQTSGPSGAIYGGGWGNR